MDDGVLAFAIGGHHTHLVRRKAGYAKINRWTPNGSPYQFFEHIAPLLHREYRQKILPEAQLRRFLHGLFLFGQFALFRVGKHVLQIFKGFPAVLAAKAGNHVLKVKSGAAH
nr:hypothetical protein [uncultured Cohaesibacter sp.]